MRVIALFLWLVGMQLYSMNGDNKLSSNDYYKPDMSRRDYETVMDLMSKDNPISELYIKLYKGGNSRTDNPNYYKIFFKNHDDKKMALSFAEKDFEAAIKESQTELDNFDKNLPKKLADAMASENSFISSIEIRVNIRRKALENASDINSKKILEDAIRKDEETINILKSRMIDYEGSFYKKNADDKLVLEKKLDNLKRLKSIITNEHDKSYGVIAPSDVRITVNVPGFTDAHAHGAFYNDFYNEGDGLKIIIFDRFNRLGEKTVDFAHDVLRFNVLEEAMGEGLTCFGAEHSCQVMGVIKRMIPYVKFIPKRHSEYPTENTDTVNEIIKNDYGARIINISANLEDEKALEKLCENHIVVMAAPNITEPNSTGYDSDVLRALKKYEHVRNNLLIVINTMPDGYTLSPITSVPGDNALAQEATVAAPGTWIMTTTPATSQRPADFETIYAYAPHGEKPSHGSFKEVSGTSFATPVVTGLVARLMASFPDLSLGDVVSIVKASCSKEGDLAKPALFGHGRIDVARAYKMAEEKTGKKALR